MDKMQALHAFWAGFGWPAYDETSMPDADIVTLPYITHESVDDSFGYPTAQTASLWDWSTSWASVLAKQKEIEQAITRGGKYVSYDGGAFIIRMGNPWAQRMSDSSSDFIRRIILNVEIEFLD